MRNLLRLTTGLTAAAVAVWGGAAAATGPNLLLILADDMGYSDASPYGGEIFTPNLARIADQGTMFTNFHVAAYCAPTRSMLLTGADNHVVGLGNMIELAADNQRRKPGYEGYLNGRAATIATILRDHGYHTYMAGKWHLGKTPDTIPAAQGFEHSVGVLEGGADNYEAKSYTPGYKTVHFFEDRGALTLPPDFYSSSYYANRMINYIDANAGDGKPFFGYLAFQAVHQPHQAPADFTARYVSTYAAGWQAIAQFRYARETELGLLPAGLKLNWPSVVPDWTSLSADDQKYGAKRMAVYAGMLEYMDYSIGRVLDHLRDKGELDNTVVVFLSDNGGEPTQLMTIFPDYYKTNFDLSYARMGEKGTYSEYGPGWAAASMTPFTNFKGSAAEGGVRAPLIVRYPAKVQAGARADSFAYAQDIVPTLLDLAGVAGAAPAGAGQQGRSLVSVLSGADKLAHPADQAVCYEAAGGAAVYRGDYKLARSAPPYGDSRWRLFDIRKDPTETTDLSATMPDVAKSLQDAYAAYVRTNGVVEVPPGYNVVSQGRTNAALQP